MLHSEMINGLKQKNKDIELFSFEKFITDQKRSISAQKRDIGALRQFFEILGDDLRKKDNFEKFLQLSNQNRVTTLDILGKLKKNQLLDQVSLDEVLAEMSLEITVKESSVSKISRKKSGAARSQFILDEKVEFFIQHSQYKEYEGGSFGKIKRGYENCVSRKTMFAVKILTQDDQTKAVEEAKRETSSQKLLRRKSFYFFRHKKAYVASEWQTGVNLNQFDKSFIIEQPYEKRILWLISGFTDLSILHAAFIVHGDIKTTNFILDIEEALLRLIDFGTSRKRNQSSVFGCSPKLVPNSEMGIRYGFGTDIYAMTFVVAVVFPELFSIIESSGKYELHVKSKTKRTPFEQGIIELVKLMQEKDCLKRPSAADAVQYCKALSEFMRDLSEEKLQNIIGKTINRKKLNVDDVIHKMELK